MSMSASEFTELLSMGDIFERVVDTDSKLLTVTDGEGVVNVSPRALESLITLPVVVACVTSWPSSLRPRWADLVVARHSQEYVRSVARAASNPLASVSLALLLRSGHSRSVAEGLVAESTTYGILQRGPEFASWHSDASTTSTHDERGETVLVTREGGLLRVALNRPHVKNAFNSTMRDELVAALHVAAIDSSITSVELSGIGVDFCSGGDLSEFGSAVDAATAHIIRMQRSAAREMYAIREKLTVRLQGWVVGAGIELSAFAHRVVASPTTKISLPELGFGLIPGAGGTVSLPRRIGRHATMLLALAQPSLDANEALSIGLVDEVRDEP